MSKFSIQDFDLYYGEFQALKNINLDIPSNQITAFIEVHLVVVSQPS